jgi:prepilin-type processing-associated H-X9-DG protein
VELLVVIAIIGVLVALLLPAVQAAREAARRMSCSNNVKNMVLAMHNYAEQNKQFPIGCRSSGGQYGQSWTVGLFPFIEQGNLWNTWVQTASWNTNGALMQPTTGPIMIPIYRCPSSPLAKTTGTGSSPTYKVQQTSYVAIAGTTSTGNVSSTPTVSFLYNGTTWNYDNSSRQASGSSPSGIVSANGMFHPESQTSFGDLSRDGSSNTIFIGEESDFLKDPSTLAQKDATSCTNYGGYAGCITAGIPGSVTSWSGQTNSVTTMRNPINYKRYEPSNGVGEGGLNCGIQSAHGGGSMVGWGDGRVAFVNENMDMVMVWRACIRDDGQPLQLPDR